MKKSGWEPRWGKRYRAYILAKRGTLLLGGVREWYSLRYKTRKEAQDILYGMDQPNIGESGILVSGAK